MRKGIFFLFSTIAAMILEKICSGIFERGIEGLLSICPFFAGWVYKRISEEYPVNLSFYLFILIVLFMTYEFTKAYRVNCETEKCKGECDRCKLKHSLKCVWKKLKDWFLHSGSYKSVLAAVWIFVFLFLTLTNYINHTTVCISNNIEIVAPYVSEMEYKELRRDFHLMNSYSDYSKLRERMERYATENGIVLR